MTLRTATLTYMGVATVSLWAGDSLIGTWSELAIVGQLRAGRIALWRVKP